MINEGGTPVIATIIFCAILVCSIGIGAGVVACCSGMVYRRQQEEQLHERHQSAAISR